MHQAHPLELLRTARTRYTQKQLAEILDVIYIAGGGIKKPEQAAKLAKAGANALQVGTIFQKTPVEKIAKLTKDFIKRIREKA